MDAAPNMKSELIDSYASELETRLSKMAQEDVSHLLRARTSYGESWRRREGVSAFMNLDRKWSRIENACAKTGWDLFQAVQKKALDEAERGSVMADIGDLRRYLMLVEEYVTRDKISANTGNLPKKVNILDLARFGNKVEFADPRYQDADIKEYEDSEDDDMPECCRTGECEEVDPEDQEDPVSDELYRER